MRKEQAMDKEFEVVARYLVPSERPLAVWRHHWLWWLRRVFFPLVACVVVNMIAAETGELMLFGAGLVCLLSVVLITLHWRRRVAFLSNQRVGEVGGILASIQESDIVALVNVQDIDVQKPGWKALLGWNDYNVQTGQGNLPLAGYPSELDKKIWAAKSGNFPSGPTQPPTSGQPPSQGGGTIIVH